MTVASEPARLRPVAHRGRAVLALAALLALLVVGVGSGSSQPPRATIDNSPGPAAVALQVLLYLVVAIVVAMVAVIVYALWPQRRRRRKEQDEPVWVYEPPRVHWAAKLLLVLLPLALAAGLVVGLLLLLGQAPVPAPPSRSLPPAAGGPPAAATQIAAGQVPWLSASWLAVVLVAGALVGVAMVLMVSASGRRGGRAADEEAAPGLAEVLEESLDALRREREPRRAVIAAYSAMERSLAARGLARRASEAPREYIARVLRRVATKPRDVHRLTDLFELAKFSDHDIDQQMRDEALQALLAIRQDLGATP